jgi:Flp pilus assembly protein TadD
MLQERADLSGAAAAFEKALRINPSNVRALNNLGLLLLRTGRLQQARPLFERALNVDPDDSFVRENLELLHRIEASPRRRNGPGNR